jgi:predicted Zn-dependent peptidase
MTTDSDKEVSSPDSTIVRLIDTIKKSDSDAWNYRGMELSNGMLCVLISHPNVDKAAAGLDVSIGSLAEPSSVPGIAHFLEHMLFMGSSKVSISFTCKVLKTFFLLFSIQARMHIKN